MRTHNFLQDVRGHAAGNVDCCVDASQVSLTKLPFTLRTPLKTLAQQAIAKEGMHIFQQALLGSTPHRDKDVVLDTDLCVFFSACHRERQCKAALMHVYMCRIAGIASTASGASARIVGGRRGMGTGGGRLEVSR